jgi:hypothetical protein
MFLAETVSARMIPKRELVSLTYCLCTQKHTIYWRLLQSVVWRLVQVSDPPDLGPNTCVMRWPYPGSHPSEVSLAQTILASGPLAP